MWVMLLPVRWLVVRANRIENRNASCLGTGGEGGVKEGVQERCEQPQGVSHTCARREIA